MMEYLFQKDFDASKVYQMPFGIMKVEAFYMMFGTIFEPLTAAKLTTIIYLGETAVVATSQSTEWSPLIPKDLSFESTYSSALFFKRWSNPGLFLFYFCPFLIPTSITVSHLTL